MGRVTSTSFTFFTSKSSWIGPDAKITFTTDAHGRWVYLDERANSPKAPLIVSLVAPQQALLKWSQLGSNLHDHYVPARMAVVGGGLHGFVTARRKRIAGPSRADRLIDQWVQWE